MKVMRTDSFYLNMADRSCSKVEVCFCVPFWWRVWMGSSLHRHTGSRPDCWWCHTNHPLQRARHTLETRKLMLILCVNIISLPHTAFKTIKAKITIAENRFSPSDIGLHCLEQMIMKQVKINTEKSKSNPSHTSRSTVSLWLLCQSLQQLLKKHKDWLLTLQILKLT